MGKAGGEEGEEESSMEVYILTYVNRQWEIAIWLRELKLELCNYLEGWEVGERFKREETYVQVPLTKLMYDRNQTNIINQSSNN